MTQCSGMATVSSLPDELLLKVFLYLDATDVALSVADVCRRWKTLANDYILWNSIKFTVDKDMMLSYVLNVMPQLPQLRLVSLHWRTDAGDILNVLCKHCPSVVHFKLICSGSVDKGFVQILAEKYPNLNVLSISKCWSVPRQCLDDIPLLTNLTSLNLSNSIMTPEQFLSISYSCPMLTSINIDYVRGISEDILIQFLSERTSKLISLSVFGELLTDTIFQHIQCCQNLKQLHISTCRMISDIYFKSICKLKCLKSLTMRKSINITPMALWRFYFLSDVVKNLSHLYISAKRDITSEDISLWLETDPDMKQNLISQFCTCILTKDGFKFEKAL